MDASSDSSLRSSSTGGVVARELCRTRGGLGPRGCEPTFGRDGLISTMATGESTDPVETGVVLVLLAADGNPIGKFPTTEYSESEVIDAFFCL